ncbi:MAG: hypothetical protein GY761_06425 [Hyphomicrobiales bacterium]|nr:hypothetical protein [Hyphomicrobiales bacterium]
MEGKMVKTFSGASRGNCSGDATLTCSNVGQLGGANPPTQCTNGATLATCENPDNLKSVTREATDVGHCCGQGTLVASEGDSVGTTPQCSSGQNLSVCDNDGETLIYK